MTDPLTTDVTPPVARITLNRSDHRNALDVPLLEAFRDAIEAVETEEGVNCAVVDANGRAFCGGGDVSLVQDGSAADVESFLRLATDTFRRIEASPVPFVCAVDGDAMGGGLELVLAADLAVADESARFGLPEATIGLIPAAGGTQRLPRAVGETVAKELIFTGRPIPADRAKDLGIVNAVSDGNAGAEARELAETVASSAPLSVRACKKLITDGMEMDVDAALDAEQAAAARIVRSADSREGIDAFFEGREPEFEGK